MKKWIVTLQCTVFANVEVEANNKKKAEEIARKSHYLDFEIEKHTLTPETLESIKQSEI